MFGSAESFAPTTVEIAVKNGIAHSAKATKFKGPENDILRDWGMYSGTTLTASVAEGF